MPQPLSAMDFLTTSTRLFEVIPDLVSRASSHDGMRLLVKGAVQSGKTRILCALALYMTEVLGQSVIVMVRNITEDSCQFRDAWTCFIGEFRRFCSSRGFMLGVDDIPPFCLVKYLENRTRSDRPTVTAVLANVSQIKKINRVVWEHITLLVDEVDMLLYGDGKKTEAELDSLLEKVHHIMGVTATTWEPLHAVEKKYFSTKNAYIMTPLESYHGIVDQDYITIQDLPTKPPKNVNNTLSFDADLLRFLVDHRNHDPITVKKSGDHTENHPFLALINTERLVRRQEGLMEDIKRHPQLQDKYTILTYNGNHITMHAPHLLPSSDLRLSFCNNKKPKKEGNTLYYRNTSLRHVLQWIKDQPYWILRFPRIVIIAQNLVGRGLTIVSHDYQWHLSHFFWRPSSTSRVESREQDQRGCGNFSDDMRCRVYCTEKDKCDLMKAHRIQEEIFSRFAALPDTPLDDALKSMTFYKEKVPSGTIARHSKKFAGTMVRTPADGGWSMEEYRISMPSAQVQPHARVRDRDQTQTQVSELTEEEDVARLCNRFKTWSKDGTNIGAFLYRLDPYRCYSRNEILILCNNDNVQRVYLEQITARHKPHRFGQILVGIEGGNQEYQLNPRLLDAYLENFKNA